MSVPIEHEVILRFRPFVMHVIFTEAGLSELGCCSAAEKSATLLAKKRHRDENRVKNRERRERWSEKMAPQPSTDGTDSLLGAEAGHASSEEKETELDVLAEELAEAER